MTMPDDTFPTPELLARLAAGDRAAFAVVVETWQRPLAGFLGRMGLPPSRWPRLRALALAAGGLLGLMQVLAFLLSVWSSASPRCQGRSGWSATTEPRARIRATSARCR